ncbi:MAG TPA: c-type cytochrome [Terriglobus sp.]
MLQRSSLWLVSGLLGFLTVTGALVAEGSAAEAEGQVTATKPTNLKVFPKDTSLQDVYTRMAQMQRDLGVQCGFCHEQDPDTKQIEYASDENPRKETARAMIRMTQDINEKYLGSLGDRQYTPPITCGNCHLGQMHPPAFEGK